jgi:predicted ribosome quality control (RQC) complex YloA/Tae2 family protein
VYPVLNWQELALFIPKLNQALSGARLDRIRVPSRPFASAGYLKSEWMLHFGTKSSSKTLIMGLAPTRCGLHIVPNDSTLRPANGAPSHAFELILRKLLEGLRLRSIEVVSGERWIRMQLGAETDPIDLWLSLIPAKRNAVITSGSDVLYTLMPIQENFPPSPRISPPLSIREDLLASLESHGIICEQEIQTEEFQRRKFLLLSKLQQKEKALAKRIGSLDDPKQSKKKGDPSEDARLGQLLQAWLYSGPSTALENGKTYFVCGDERVLVNPAWGDAKSHMKRYFDRSKKTARGEIEHTEKRELWTATQNETLKRIDTLGQIKDLDFAALTSLEGVVEQQSPKQGLTTIGRASTSVEGFLIQTGRNSKENLELTLKVARGNDLWFHIKGRPSAHTIIRIPAGKSASLETLLLASRLTLFYSGGRGWGKTEVDYTFRKYVKRIPGTTEVQYTQNKTLVVDCPEDFKPPAGSV